MLDWLKGDYKKTSELLKQEMELMEKKNEELRKANEEAEAARLDAIAANAAKGRFLAHMSHEIRTPINAILGMDTMILREAKDSQIKDYAMDIQNAGQTLLALINDILDFSKIESGKLEIIQAEYDFSSLMHDIFNMIRVKAEAKKLELKLFVDENIPSKLFGDDVRLRQVLVNLLNNAVKYTQQGTVTLRVGGQVEGRRVRLDFSVEDTGIGIKEEDIGKLFHEFERIEEKRNRTIEGTGLGLNITTQILTLMGSMLNVESSYGKGSRFFFSLEQQIVDSTPIGNLEERIREQSANYSYHVTFTAPEAKVLVVDDNLMNLKVFVNLLKTTKICVDMADSGKACLEMIGKNSYDIIFLDHMMPEMDGIETLHHMKEQKENRCIGTPVVALTANAISGAKEMYLSEGFDAFLPKPINPEKLEQMILKLLPRELLKFDETDEAEPDTQNAPEEVMTVQEVPGHSASLSEDFLPMVDGIDWSYGYLHLPDAELLKETVGDFYKTIEVEADTLQEFYVQLQETPSAIGQYRIKVHSMKSAANLIGATVLGGMAKLLENAARDGNVELIEAMHDIFLREWLSYREKLMDCVMVGQMKDAEASQEAEQIKAAEAGVVSSCLEKLKEAIAELDIDAMDEAMKQLQSFRYPEDIQEKINRLEVYIINMDSERAEGLVAELEDSLDKM